MAYIVSDRYKQIIYSGDARNKLKLLFNNVELQDADRYCEKLTIKSRIIPNGAKIFSLNNFISKEAELILHDIDTSIIQNQVSISIGTLVGNSYEYVPIGIFNIENQPTNDKNKTTIKLRDNSIKFDFNYNAQPLIEENGGSATKLQILRDICSQAGVTCNISSFIGYIDEIGVYDNTISAREYVSRIAEQAGKIATINRRGELIFVNLNDLRTWEIPIDIVEKYENGTKFKIGRVVYEDGIVRYETEDSNDDTLFLDSSNNYINNEKVLLQARSNDNQYHLENTNDDNLAYMEIYGQTTQETQNIGKNMLLIGNVSNTLGLTITRVANSEIRISGMTSGAGTINIPLGASYTLSSVPYTFSITSTGTINKNIFISLYQSASLNNLSMSSASTTSLTSTNENGRVINAIQIVVQSATRFTNFDMKFQLEQSTSATSFEQYSFPMPSPEKPSELVSVGYENLFGSNLKQGCRLFANGNYANVANYVCNENPISVEEEKTYIISAENYIPKSEAGFVFFNNGTFVSSLKTSSLTFTVPIGANQVYYNFYTSTNITPSDITLPQITKGTQQHSYIPYGKYGIEVKTTGKNLIRKATRLNGSLLDSITVNGITFTNLGGGHFHISGTATERTDCYTFRQSSEQESIIVPIGTYTFSTPTLPNGVTLITSGGGGNNGFAYTELTSSLLSATSNVTDGTKPFNYFLIRVSSGTTVDTDIYFMLEQGTQATTYEPYKSNTYLYQLDEPLRSIGNIKDLLYIKNGYLYVDRKIGSVDLSTITWNKYGHNVSGYSRYSSTTISNIKYVSANTQLGNGMAEKYIITIGSGISNKTDMIAIDISQVSVTDKQSPTGEFIYELAEPYTETLGAIEVPSTYKGVTYIDIDSNIYTDSYVKYRKEETQLEAILEETNQFNIDSLKTGKILGNPAIDSYDLIQIHDKSRNLFDKNNINLINAYYIDGTGKIVYGNNNRLTWLKLQPNTTYTLTQTKVSRVTRRIALFTNEPVANSQGALVGTFTETTPINQTFTTTDTNIYVAWVYCNLANLNGHTEQEMLNNIQLEQGNVATDYVPFKDETYTTLATNDLVYTGVLINTFDTQIGEETKEQNVFINGEETFKKWARTKIDNVEGTLTLQAGEINEVNGKINSTTLQLSSQGALLNVLANNSNIDVEYDNDGNPLSGEVREVTTTTGFTFNAEGMTIEDSNSNFKALHRNDGTYYKEGEEIVGQYTKDGSKQKDLQLFGVYYYGMRDKDDTPMFVAQLYNDNNGEECFGHFYNRGD